MSDGWDWDGWELQRECCLPYTLWYGSDGSDIYHLYGNFLDETVQRKEVLIDWINSEITVERSLPNISIN